MSAVREQLPDGLWYVQRGEHIRGPFRWDVITRNIALGRIHVDDRLSQDASNWRALTDLAQALPLPPSPPFQLRDERRGDRRVAATGANASDDGRSGHDRRRPEAASVVAQRAHSERVWAGLRAPLVHAARLPLLVVALVLCASVATALRWSPSGATGTPDCSARAAPAVNWDFCAKPDLKLRHSDLTGASARNARLTKAALIGSNLRDADLAYADLGGADLTLVDASGARLVGASLRGARLNQAQLLGADLSFADLANADLAGVNLTAARLGNAIWIDGRVCQRESIGRCDAPSAP